MLKEILHIGVTVSNMDRSLDFYQNVLGLTKVGELMMKGENTDKLFNIKDCEARVCYLNGSDNIACPPVELIQFNNIDIIKDKAKLDKTSISEICFKVDDIDKVYENLLKNNVKCLSEPQYFDFTEYGFSKSKALYFLDPDDIVLELIQTID